MNILLSLVILTNELILWPIMIQITKHLNQSEQSRERSWPIRGGGGGGWDHSGWESVVLQWWEMMISGEWVSQCGGQCQVGVGGDHDTQWSPLSELSPDQGVLVTASVRDEDTSGDKQ